MKKVLLVGNGITARIIQDYLEFDLRYDLLGRVVDDEYVDSNWEGSLPTIPLSIAGETYSHDSIALIMAMGYSDLNRSRERMFVKLKRIGYKVETYVHPDAKVYSKCTLGEGAVILPNAVIEPSAKVGSNTVVWSGAVIAHHSCVGDHCWIAANSTISGNTTIGRNVFVGVNTTIVNNITVGDFNILGASSLISRSTKANSVLLSRSAETIRYSAEDYAKYIGY